jgi:methylmalonyl-CoA mutase
MRKNLQHIRLEKPAKNQQFEETNFLTAEGISLKKTYSEQDIENLEHLDFGAGFAPNLRGINTTTSLQKTLKTEQDNDFVVDFKTVQPTRRNVAIELAQTLTKGLEIIQTELKKGMNIDEIASQISFSFGIGMNHFTEIAKMRAARMLWAKLMQQFEPKNQKSFEFRIRSQISKSDLEQENSFNTITRNCIQATIATLGGSQSIEIHSVDGNNASSDAIFNRIAQNMDCFLNEETKINQTVDPWGGSFYVENLTHQIIQTTWQYLQEMDNEE